MKSLPPPPVPQKLRELLKDDPDLIQRLQDLLDDVVAKPSPVTPLFELFIWSLEDELDGYISEARESLKAAEANGDQKMIRKADEKERLTRFARSSNRGMSDLNELRVYADQHKALVP